jgi:hypothetical protein
VNIWVSGIGLLGGGLALAWLTRPSGPAGASDRRPSSEGSGGDEPSRGDEPGRAGEPDGQGAADEPSVLGAGDPDRDP